MRDSDARYSLRHELHGRKADLSSPRRPAGTALLSLPSDLQKPTNLSRPGKLCCLAEALRRARRATASVPLLGCSASDHDSLGPRSNALAAPRGSTLTRSSRTSSSAARCFASASSRATCSSHTQCYAGRCLLCISSLRPTCAMPTTLCIHGEGGKTPRTSKRHSRVSHIRHKLPKIRGSISGRRRWANQGHADAG